MGLISSRTKSLISRGTSTRRARQPKKRRGCGIRMHLFGRRSGSIKRRASASIIEPRFSPRKRNLAARPLSSGSSPRSYSETGMGCALDFPPPFLRRLLHDPGTRYDAAFRRHLAPGTIRIPAAAAAFLAKQARPAYFSCGLPCYSSCFRLVAHGYGNETLETR